MTKHKTIVLFGVFFVLGTRAMETPADEARRAHQIAVVTQALEEFRKSRPEKFAGTSHTETATGHEDGSWNTWWNGFKNPPLHGHEGLLFESANPKTREQMRAIYAFRRTVGMSARLCNFLKHKFWG